MKKKFKQCVFVHITIPPPEKRQIITFKTKYHVWPPTNKIIVL